MHASNSIKVYQNITKKIQNHQHKTKKSTIFNRSKLENQRGELANQGNKLPETET